jgi:hypothetical protein
MSDDKWFWLQPAPKGESTAREGMSVIRYAKKIGYKVGWGKITIRDFIPVGDVDFCEGYLNFKPKPDFAPKWLSDYFHRDISIKQITEKNDLCENECFVKSASEYKKYPAKIFNADDKLPLGLQLFTIVFQRC